MFSEDRLDSIDPLMHEDSYPNMSSEYRFDRLPTLAVEDYRPEDSTDSQSSEKTYLYLSLYR